MNRILLRRRRLYSAVDENDSITSVFLLYHFLSLSLSFFFLFLFLFWCFFFFCFSFLLPFLFFLFSFPFYSLAISFFSRENTRSHSTICYFLNDEAQFWIRCTSLFAIRLLELSNGSEKRSSQFVRLLSTKNSKIDSRNYHFLLPARQKKRGETAKRRRKEKRKREGHSSLNKLSRSTYHRALAHS